jgi:hypothetical protein
VLIIYDVRETQYNADRYDAILVFRFENNNTNGSLTYVSMKKCEADMKTFKSEVSDASHVRQ